MVKRLLILGLVPFIFACAGKTQSKVVYLDNQMQNKKVAEVSPQAKEKIKKKVYNEAKLPETKAKEIEKVVGQEKEKAVEKVKAKVKKVLTPYKELKIKKETALLKDPITPIKLPDTIIRVLLLPYVDDKQTFHSGEYLFVKVEEGKWILGNYIHKNIKRKTKEYNPLVEVKEWR